MSSSVGIGYSPTDRLLEASRLGRAWLPGGARDRDLFVDGDWEIVAGLFARFFGVCGAAAAGTRGGDGGVALSRRGLRGAAFGDSGSAGTGGAI